MKKECGGCGRNEGEERRGREERRENVEERGRKRSEMSPN